MKEKECEYCPEKSDIEYWFGVINEAVFSHALPNFNEIHINDLDDVWAWFEHFGETESHELQMHHTYDSKQLFLNVLAHEMVHLYQQINNQPLGHGKSFRRWERDFEENYLTLQRKW
jgi:hypothetical protein